MRKVTIGGETRSIHASSKSAIIYAQAFGYEHDIYEDINVFLNAKTGPLVLLPAMPTLRLFYTYERTTYYPKPFEDFDEWVDELPDDALDMSPDGTGDALVTQIVNETVRCFFRRFYREDVDATATEEDAEGTTEGTE